MPVSDCSTNANSTYCYTYDLPSAVATTAWTGKVIRGEVFTYAILQFWYWSSTSRARHHVSDVNLLRPLGRYTWEAYYLSTHCSWLRPVRYSELSSIRLLETHRMGVTLTLWVLCHVENASLPTVCCISDLCNFDYVTLNICWSPHTNFIISYHEFDYLIGIDYLSGFYATSPKYYRHN